MEVLEAEDYNQMFLFYLSFYPSIRRIFAEEKSYSLHNPLLIVEKFIREIENRGVDFEGIYRLSGVKTKAENLMKDFQKSSY